MAELSEQWLRRTNRLRRAGGGSLHPSPEAGVGPRALLPSQVPIILGKRAEPLYCTVF